MIAIGNSGFLTACNVCGTAGFVPAVGYVYDAAAKTITITDASAFAGGDGLKIVQIHVTDGNGNMLYGKVTVTGGGGALAIDTSTLDPFIGYTITVTVVTNKRMLADLAAYQVGAIAPASGNLRYKNVNQESNN